MPVALITGAAGQDGLLLGGELVSLGWRVHGVVRDTSVDRVTPGVEATECDIRDAGAIMDLVLDIAPDSIFNLASISSVAASWKDPASVLAVNGLGALNVFLAARALTKAGKHVKVIHASSAEIFGDPSLSPQTETTPMRPRNPYGAAKAFAHSAASIYRDQGLDVTSLILYNHESTFRPPTFASKRIARGVARIAGGLAQKLALGNLESRRDWGWAPDYVDAMIRAQSVTSATDVVIATGESHSVEEFVRRAFIRVGIEDWANFVEQDIEALRPTDTAELVGDYSKAQQLLGWEPTYRFNSIVDMMVDDELRHLSKSEVDDK